MNILCITAQRVKANDGTSGINAFIFETKESTLPSSAKDFSKITQNPGTLISEIIQISPGGNLVASYLDVICQDDLSTEALEAFDTNLASFRSMSEKPFFVQNGNLAVGFSFSGHVENPPDEYNSLVSVVKKIYIERPELIPVKPYKVIAKIMEFAGDKQYALELDAHSKKRVASNNPLPSIIVRQEVMEALKSTYGNAAIPELVAALTGIPQQKLASAGGFVIEMDRKIVFKWPLV